MCPRSPPPEPATSSPGSSPPSSRRASSRGWPPPPAPSRTGAPPASPGGGAGSSPATWSRPFPTRSMHRSEITVDLGAVRRNVATLQRALETSEVWAVVKADGYGHGAVDVAGAALAAGAATLCVATVAEGLELRAHYRDARVLVMGPWVSRDLAAARGAG